MISPKADRNSEKLAQAVKDALWRSQPIRALGMDHLDVEVRDGIVELRGVIGSEPLRAMAERIARAVPGVDKIANFLVTDDMLERRIAVDLANNPDTKEYRIAVNVSGGVVGLYGAVTTVEAAESARALAMAVPEVTGVENHLFVIKPGQRVTLAWQQSLEGRPPLQPQDVPAGADDAGPEAAATSATTAPVGAASVEG